jgi:post-segregation antitoxin (ccd killing protein)
MVASLAAATLGLVTAGLVRARRKEQATRWTLLNEAVSILRRAERRAGDTLAALAFGEPVPDADWRAALVDEAEALRRFLRRAVVETATARWVEDAIGHLASAQHISDDELEDDLTDWLVRLAAAREQIARIKRAARPR